ncbi:MAG TPA: hypothetical protein V6C63_14570 [Allocoleopsis sp.]
MQVSIKNNNFCIELNFWEKLWSLQFNHTWQIPLHHIEQATTTAPVNNWQKLNWKEVKLPGTFVPGVIKAGTYYSDRGREFWYVTADQNYLTLELKDEFYQRVILTVEQNQRLVAQLHSNMNN